jgi:hypothetical protein
LAREQLAATALRGFVYRQFRLSCLECCRRENGFLKRYAWRVNGSILCLWFPRSMSGRDCRRWLEARLTDVNPPRLDERERIQAIIDAHLVVPRFVAWEEGCDLAAVRGQAPAKTVSLEEISVRGLAAVVADEKAENITLQRPAIQHLGRDRLKELIRCVFDELTADDHKDSQLAREFGLSKATFSRFAASRFHRHADGYVVPDLFRNVARLLGGFPALVEAARALGVWERIEAIRIQTEQREHDRGE